MRLILAIVVFALFGPGLAFCAPDGRLARCEPPPRPINNIEVAYIEALRAWSECAARVTAINLYYTEEP